MTKSGITRHIDELGRIVVPKEIRCNLGIRDGEPLEIYTEDNAIIIKKYSQIENIKAISIKICEIINEVCDLEIIITDREKIISTNTNINHLINTILIDKYKQLIDNRENYISEKEEKHFNLIGHFTMLPIITSTDCSGLIIIISKEKSLENLKYAKIVQKIIVQKLDVA